MAQIIIRRFFITGVKINEAGERAVKYQRRPLIGEPSFHFCPFRTASLYQCGVVIGIDLKLNMKLAEMIYEIEDGNRPMRWENLDELAAYATSLGEPMSVDA